MPLRKWIVSANYAIEGILHAAKTQRHMRYHLYAAMALLIVSFVLGVSGTEFVVLITLTVLVISVEMLNTAVEIITDILFKEYDQRAKIIKDTAAGAVLVTAVGAVLVGYIILIGPVKKYFSSGLSVAKHTEADVAVVALLAVLILVVITKAFFGYLAQLQENLERSGLPRERHKTLRREARRALAELAADERFDGIVLDPPTAAAAGRRFWSVRRDLDPLAAAALARLAPGGFLLLTRQDRSGRAGLAALVERVAGIAGVRLRSVEPAPPSADFPALRGFPEAAPFEAVLATRD